MCFAGFFAGRKYAEMTVMTYNIRAQMFNTSKEDEWTERRESLVKHILRNSPDLVGMQEVRLSQRQYFDEFLTGYAFIGRGDEEGIAEMFGGGTYIYYRKDRLELLEEKYYWLSETPEVSSRGWDAESKRMAVFGKFRDKLTGKVFVHCNTHLDNAGKESQINGLTMILGMLEERGLPAVLTGDFNVFEDSGAYKMAAEAMSDTKYIAKTTMKAGTFHNYGKADHTSPIDFIFVSPGLFNAAEYRVLAEKVDGKFTSDHYAVIARITALK